MGRRRGLRGALIAVVVMLVLFTLFIFLVGKPMLDEKDKQIADFEKKVSKEHAYAFSHDMKAGTIITPGDVKIIEITQDSKTIGMYLENNKKTYDENGSELSWANLITDRIKENDAEGNIDITLETRLDENIYGRAIKANVMTNTPIIEPLMYVKNDIETRDERIEEMSDSFLSIPSDLDVGDYFDLRIRYADGQDLIVLTGKKVDRLGPNDAGDYASAKSFYTKLSESERMLFVSSLIEAYMNDGTTLYATKYIDPSTQLFKESIVDYIERYQEGIKKAIEAKDLQKMIAIMKKTDENANEDTYNALTTAEKDSLKKQITPTKESDLTDAEIAGQARIKVEFIPSIREALKEGGEDNPTIAFYRKYREQTRTPIAVTYAVTDAVRKAIKETPNIVESVKEGFKVREQTRISRDRLAELEEMYKNAPTKAEVEARGERGVKTKEDLQGEIDNLAKTVGDRINKANSEQQKRREYLLSLIYGG